MTKYSPELAESIAELVASGVPQVHAAQAHYVHRNTYMQWIKDKSAFSALVQAKRAEAIAERVERIRQAGVKGLWTADAWWLERQEPELFMLRTKVDNQAAPITINLIIPPGTAVKDQIDKWADVVEIEAQDVKQIEDIAGNNAGNTEGRS